MPPSPSRRHVVRTAGAFAALGALPGPVALAAPAEDDITGRLARYMLSARTRPLPEEAVLACKHRILDSLGAMVSGARLGPGIKAAAYVRGLGGVAEASVVASSLRTSAVEAAFANAMFAHADETDDLEPVTKAHPGASATPAALAMAEKNGASGAAFIRAVALGYDVGCRLLKALDSDLLTETHRSPQAIGATFCALGAAAGLARLDEAGMRAAISYAAQQASGLGSWLDDEDHIEKAFDFAGMGARNGVMAATMAEAGLTGVRNVLDSKHNLFVALAPKPHPGAMVEDLGSRFYVTESAIKTFSVGYPNQSALDALLALRSQHGLTPANVQSISVKLPPDAIAIVANSAMADVNCAHLISVALIKGTVSFKDSHDTSLMKDPAVLALRRKVQVMAEPTLADPAAPRGAIVEVSLTDGRTVARHIRFPSGSKDNPLSTEGVNAKARDLMAPVLGRTRTERLIGLVNRLEALDDVRRLRPLLTA